RTLVHHGVHVIWGDVSQRDTLEQAGIVRATMVFCTLPNTLLRGTTNLRLVQLVRSVNPGACIVAHAELLSDVPRLKAAGATYIHAPRLHDAEEFLELIEAADKQLLHDKLAELERRLGQRTEVIP